VAGGLLQLVAYSAQDIYLTADPQITYFKVVYRRHTTFSIQAFEKTFNEKPTFGKTAKVKLFRLGDLATKMYLRVVVATLSSNTPFAWIRRLGHALISEVRIEIGGCALDKHVNVWLDVWYELTRWGMRDEGYRKMIGDVDAMTEYNNNTKPEYTMYIPLQFWFNRHYGLALPLIAIYYSDIYIRVTLEDKENLLVRSPLFTNFEEMKILDFGLVTDYIYLDINERKRFAVSCHEFLIDQVQFTYADEITNISSRTFIDYTGPTKELIWLTRNTKFNKGIEFLCYSNKDDWTPAIVQCSKKILQNSMLLLEGNKYIIDSSGNKILVEQGEDVMLPGSWIMFDPDTVSYSPNHGLKIVNNSLVNALWLNIDSLSVGLYSLTATITGTIIVDMDDKITILVTQGLSDKDISIPLADMTDTRLNGPHPGIYVYQFSNYGLYITGKKNPVESALLQYNGDDRFTKRDGNFFGILQPYLHHNSTPADGINIYSFAIEPEKHQPTGVSNLSAIDTVVLSLWYNPELLYNGRTDLYVFAFSYNIFKVSNGMAGLIY
jgi:hypothetical protein